MKLFSHKNSVRICIGILICILVIFLAILSNGIKFNNQHKIIEGIEEGDKDDATIKINDIQHILSKNKSSYDKINDIQKIVLCNEDDSMNKHPPMNIKKLTPDNNVVPPDRTEPFSMW